MASSTTAPYTTRVNSSRLATPEMLHQDVKLGRAHVVDRSCHMSHYRERCGLSGRLARSPGCLTTVSASLVWTIIKRPRGTELEMGMNRHQRARDARGLTSSPFADKGNEAATDTDGFSNMGGIISSSHKSLSGDGGFIRGSIW